MYLMETCQEFIKRKEAQFKNEKALIPMKDIGREGTFYYKREAWTFMPQTNLSEKVFVIERIKLEKLDGNFTYEGSKDNELGQVEYRIGYYIIGKIGKANGRWVWGQFCPLIPKDDFDKLFAKAKAEGTIL